MFEKYNATEVYCHFKDAIVNITGVSIATISGAPITLTYSGNGFFITRRHFIVCPAHLVILPPVLGALRVPPPPLTGSGAITQPVPVQNIYVTVFNVNGTRDSYVYNATLVGVDGAGDIALLKLSPNSGCNSGAPKIKHCHPYLKFGDSLKYSPGNKVFSIGTLFSPDFRSVAEGIVRNNKGFNQNDVVVYELMSTTLPYNAQITRLISGALTVLQSPDGAPILDVTGHIVGMITVPLSISTPSATSGLVNAAYNSDDYAVGVSQRFMRCVLKSLIKSYCQNKAQHQTVLLTDTGLGTTFWNYRKGFIGTSYQVVDDRFYAGALSTSFGATGATGATCRRILGIVSNPVSGTGAAGFTGPSGNVLPGDLITHVNCTEIGNLPDQLALSTFDWRKISGECAKLTIVHQNPTPAYSTCAEAKITYVDFPAIYDYSPQDYNTNFSLGVL